mmetsp:Transcript_40094/g.96808  ORF Transcript_40094/g.96808 Transcript_40094/m.96808 type:complete len:84 (+) Transcript_40094:214-465(+)
MLNLKSFYQTGRSLKNILRRNMDFYHFRNNFIENNNGQWTTTEPGPATTTTATTKVVCVMFKVGFDDCPASYNENNEKKICRS